MFMLLVKSLSSFQTCMPVSMETVRQMAGGCLQAHAAVYPNAKPPECMRATAPSSAHPLCCKLTAPPPALTAAVDTSDAARNRPAF